MSQDIVFYNRYTGKKETEKVYGKEAVEFAYNSLLGKVMAPIIASRFVSKLYGNMQDKPSSAQKVPEFLQNFEIKVEDYEKGSFEDKEFKNSFKSFNEFFIRKFKTGKRSYPKSNIEMGAPAEARYIAVESINDEMSFPVKGAFLRPKDLLKDSKFSSFFNEGPLMIARLCPVDYHRYHYMDNGTTLENYTIHGDFHSVNPIALKYRNDIFIKNERRVSILETENFGKIAYIEVGATCVGKIVQSHNEKEPYIKGSEKGYFLFGGSTVIIIGEKGKWSPSQDIINNTKNSTETYIHLGDTVGTKNL